MSPFWLCFYYSRVCLLYKQFVLIFLQSRRFKLCVALDQILFQNPWFWLDQFVCLYHCFELVSVQDWDINSFGPQHYLSYINLHMRFWCSKIAVLIMCMRCNIQSDDLILQLTNIHAWHIILSESSSLFSVCN